MPLQASLFDTAPHQAAGPRITSKAEMFRDACALMAPWIAAGFDDATISSGGVLWDVERQRPCAAPGTPDAPTAEYRAGIGCTYAQLGAVHCYRDQGQTYARFPLADIRAHLDTTERRQERMF